MNMLKTIANPTDAELFVKSLPTVRTRSPQLSCRQGERCRGILRTLAALVLLAVGSVNTARGVDYHVATAQQLQTALTLAAASSVSNNIYVTNGYYTGNFNYSSAKSTSLTILAETNVASSQVVIDGGGLGSSLNISDLFSPNITVQGLTLLRNCGSISLGSLQIAGGNTAILVSGCSFLSPTNSDGMGLVLSSGLTATVTNCVAAGNTTGGNSGDGPGIYISGITNSVAIQNCVVTTNINGYPSGSTSIPGGGLSVSGAGTVTVTGSLFIGNSANGGGASGAGAYCSGTTITVTGNTFIGNSGSVMGGPAAVSAGGAACSGTTITLSGNTFTGNSANGWWDVTDCGGASCSATRVTLTSNIFTGNSGSGGNSDNAGYGYGGAYCSGIVILSGNTFVGNSSSGSYGGYGSGGGACCTGTVTLSNNIFSANSSSGFGGGAYCSSSVTNPMVLFGNTFQQNSAAFGGGLYVTGPTVNLLDNLAFQNAVTTTNSSQGGGIWMDATGTLNMVNNTVTGNTSAGTGGGVAYVVTANGTSLNVYNNIIWGNTAFGNGGDVWLSGTAQSSAFDFNDANSLYGVWGTALSDTNISPQFFNPVGGDYHLQSTSPCDNAGTPNAPSLSLTDLDGNSRTNSSGLVDMGCYEFNTTAAHPADTNGGFVITSGEYAAYAAAWKAGQPWTSAPMTAPNPNPISANYVTRAGYLMTNGGSYYNNGSARPANWRLIGQ